MISSEVGKEVIKKELPLIPKLPGVYRMLNDKGDILYVGKAKNLPNRLKSYVAEKNHIIRTERMLSQTRKLEITTTSNESEALLLEANLIKKYKPKFNILLRDDKSFPFIFIGNKDKWPQIKRHRGKKVKEGFSTIEEIKDSELDNLAKIEGIEEETAKECSSVGIQITKKRSHDKF